MSESVKIRILQRDDGAVFTRTPILEANPRMRPGWQIIHPDGRVEIVLDAATVQQLNPNTISKRETLLMEENARLREQLARAQGFTNSPVLSPPPVPPAPPAPELLPGEIPLPPVPSESEIVRLAREFENPAPLEEDVIPLAPEPEILTEAALNRMKKDDLVEHARLLNSRVVIPESATRPDIIEICLTEQDAYLQRTMTAGVAE